MHRIILSTLLAILLLMGCAREWENPYDPQVPIEVWTPDELRITSLGRQALELAWDPVAKVDVDYLLQRAQFGAQGALGEFADVLTTRTTAAVDSSLPTSTERLVYRLLAQADERVSDPAPDMLTTWWDAGDILWTSSMAGSISALTLNADGSQMAAVTGIGGISVWNLLSSPVSGVVNPYVEIQGESYLQSMDLSADGSLLVTGHMDGALMAYQLPSGSSAWAASVPQADGGFVSDIAIAPNGEFVATASWDLKIRTWKASNGQERWVSQPYQYGCISVAVSPDNKYVAGGSADSTFRVFDASDGNVRFSAQHTAGGDELMFTADSRYILSIGWKELGLWDVKTGDRLWLSREPSNGKFPLVVFTPDGDGLICSNGDELLFLDLLTGTVDRRVPLTGVTLGITLTALAIHPEEPYVYYGNGDGELAIMNLEDGSRHWSTQQGNGVGYLAVAGAGGMLIAADSYYTLSEIRIHSTLDQWVSTLW